MLESYSGTVRSGLSLPDGGSSVPFLKFRPVIIGAALRQLSYHSLEAIDERAKPFKILCYHIAAQMGQA
jgi:hypothetical protein